MQGILITWRTKALKESKERDVGEINLQDGGQDLEEGERRRARSGRHYERTEGIKE